MVCFILCVGVDGKGSDGGLSSIISYVVWDIQKGDSLWEENVCTFSTPRFRFVILSLFILRLLVSCYGNDEPHDKKICEEVQVLNRWPFLPAAIRTLNTDTCVRRAGRRKQMTDWTRQTEKVESCCTEKTDDYRYHDRHPNNEIVIQTGKNGQTGNFSELVEKHCWRANARAHALNRRRLTVTDGKSLLLFACFRHFRLSCRAQFR